jgi:hypothetical protein
MVAARYNPQLKSFRDKLVAAGKPKLIALVAEIDAQAPEEIWLPAGEPGHGLFAILPRRRAALFRLVWTRTSSPPFAIDGAPQINQASINFLIDFVQVPGRVGLGSAFAQARCDHRSAMVDPTPNGLVRDHDAAFRQQLFDVTKAQCEPEIEARAPAG